MKTYDVSIKDNQSTMTTILTKVSASALKKLITKLVTDNTGVKLLFKEPGKRNIKTSKTVTDRNYCLEDGINLKPNNNE